MHQNKAEGPDWVAIIKDEIGIMPLSCSEQPDGSVRAVILERHVQVQDDCVQGRRVEFRHFAPPRRENFAPRKGNGRSVSHEQLGPR